MLVSSDTPHPSGSIPPINLAQVKNSGGFGWNAGAITGPVSEIEVTLDFAEQVDREVRFGLIETFTSMSTIGSITSDFNNNNRIRYQIWVHEYVEVGLGLDQTHGSRPSTSDSSLARSWAQGDTVKVAYVDGDFVYY